MLCHVGTLSNPSFMSNKDFRFYRFKAYNLELVECFMHDCLTGVYDHFGKLFGLDLTFHPTAHIPFYTCIASFNPKFN